MDKLLYLYIDTNNNIHITFKIHEPMSYVASNMASIIVLRGVILLPNAFS